MSERVIWRDRDFFRRLVEDASHCSLHGMTLEVTLALTDQEFDLAWDALDEIDPLGENTILSIPKRGQS